MSTAPAITPDHPFYPIYNLLVEFKQRHVPPPALVYVTRDDVLQLTMAAPTVATTVQLSLRLLSPQGEVIPRFETFTIGPTAGTPTTKLLQNCEGYLLSASVLTPGAPLGQCFISLAIRRGGGSSDATFGDILLQGYPGSTGGIAFPQSLITSVTDSGGLIRVLTVANPAAGADFSTTVPVGVQWLVRSVHALFTASAAVANRLPKLRITDAVPNTIFTTTDSQTVTASNAGEFSFAPGGNNIFGSAVFNFGLPQHFRLQAGFILRSVTAGIQAADQWSQIVLTVEEISAG